MTTRELRSWEALARSTAARGTLGEDLAAMRKQPADVRWAFVEAFRDDAGHRREVDRPLLAWCLALEQAHPPASPRRDVALWWSLTNPEAPDIGPLLTPSGALCPELREEGIEVWTEAELAALQALWWHAHVAGHGEWRLRSIAAAEWLMQELQPDNATNRPWAYAVFAELAASAARDDAALYAETLLHNCQVQAGRADRLSCVLLLDAADRLAPAKPDRT